MDQTIEPKQNLSGTFSIPGDKSISHRSIMLGAIASGITEIRGFLMGDDCLSTISCFKKLGIQIEQDQDHVLVYGKGIRGLTPSPQLLDVGNSGTTLRLMSGLLVAQPFSSYISGDASIQKRPMDRIAKPLAKMGAKITGSGSEKLTTPLFIEGRPLQAIRYELPVASAQVKSAILLAGLYANSETTIVEPEKTRDHTEIMLNYLGARIDRKDNEIICHPVKELYGKPIFVPGDISSAAYFLVAGSICQNSSLTITGVGVNETRTGILTALNQMGAKIETLNHRKVNGEEIADLKVESSSLKATEIGGSLIPRLIDEIPILAVAACFASGTTVIKNAEELKVKESNRIQTVVCELKKLGADIEETKDGMRITGGKPLLGASVLSHNDHRIAMSLSIAGLVCHGQTKIKDAECVDISFPRFYDYIATL